MKSRTLPVVDACSLADPEVRRVLDEACREWGFFYVANHGIPPEVISSLRNAMHGFFHLPQCEKRRLSRTADCPWGFFDRELTKNTRDWKEIFDVGPVGTGRPESIWPDAMPPLRPAVLEFYARCENLSRVLLNAIACNLGVEGGTLLRHFGSDHSSFLRLNYYPRCDRPERPAGCETPASGHLGVNHHTDSGALTLLLQDEQPGLEVLHEGVWKLVHPRQNMLVCNIGDIVQVWSNDRYSAALHRVLANRWHERFSAPFFFNPAYSARYEPLESCVDRSRPPRYRAINWGEFRRLRAAGDYADLGAEVQISHYRISGDRS